MQPRNALGFSYFPLSEQARDAIRRGMPLFAGIPVAYGVGRNAVMTADDGNQQARGW